MLEPWVSCGERSMRVGYKFKKPFESVRWRWPLHQTVDRLEPATPIRLRLAPIAFLS